MEFTSGVKPSMQRFTSVKSYCPSKLFTVVKRAFVNVSHLHASIILADKALEPTLLILYANSSLACLVVPVLSPIPGI